jgi:hypothetical protein
MRKVMMATFGVAVMLALASCAGGLSVGVSGQAIKKGSKCVMNDDVRGHFIQGEDGVVRCVKDK